MFDFEMQELAGLFCGLTEEVTEYILDGDEDFDTPLQEKFGIDFDQFTKIMGCVEEHITLGKSPLSDKFYICFVRNYCCVGFKKEVTVLKKP